MDVTASVDAPVDPATLFGRIDLLDHYPPWLDIVQRVEGAEPNDQDEGPAWIVDLGTRVGPLQRSKRLRMVRTVCREPSEVVFERRERDGRDYSPWVLSGVVTELKPRLCRLEMRLNYGGALFGPVLERLLQREIDAGRERLLAWLAAG